MKNRYRLITMNTLLIFSCYQLFASVVGEKTVPCDIIEQHTLNKTVLDSEDYSGTEKLLWLKNHPECANSPVAKDLQQNLERKKMRKNEHK